MINEIYSNSTPPTRLDKSISHCLFCLKHVPNKNGVAVEAITEKRFFTFLERYLSVTLSASGLYDQFPICENCVKLVDSFCQLYDEVRKLELKMDWNIWKLRRIMVCAGRVPSRMTSNLDYYKDKGDGVTEQFCSTRKCLMKTCENKLSKGFPRVSLDRRPILTESGIVKSPELKDNLGTIPGQTELESSSSKISDGSQTILESECGFGLPTCDDHFEDTELPLNCEENVEIIDTNSSEVNNSENALEEHGSTRNGGNLITPSFGLKKEYGSEADSANYIATPSPVTSEVDQQKMEPNTWNEDEEAIKSKIKSEETPECSSHDSDCAVDDNDGINELTISGKSRRSLRHVLSCTKCQKTFSNQQSFESHQSVHEENELDDDNDNEETENDRKRLKTDNDEESSDGDSDFETDGEDGNEKSCSRKKKKSHKKVTWKSNKSSTPLPPLWNQWDNHKCQLCSKSTSSLQSFIVHLHNKHNMNKSKKVLTKEKILNVRLQCMEKHFTHPNSSLGEVMFDLFNELNKKKIYSCQVPTCEKEFELPEQLETHSKLHGEFKCNFCDVVENFAPDLANHELLLHSTKERDSMDPCSETDSNKDGARTKKTVAGIKIYCPRCSFYCKHHKTLCVHHHLSKHLGLQPDTDQIACSICKYIFYGEQYNTLKVAIRRHHKTFHDLTDTTDPTSVKHCDQCPAFFLNSAQLTSHTKTIHQNGTFICKDCNKRFQSAKKYSRHRVRVHKPELKFKCGVEGCTNSHFETELELSRHVNRSHTGSKSGKLVCSQCGKITWTPAALKHHIRIVHQRPQSRVEDKNKKFVCEQCGKAFKNKNNLEMHHLSHSGPDSWKFTCSVCSKKCPTKQKVNEHMRTHSQVKMFVCQYCGAEYAHRHNLRIHVNNKHGDIAKDIPRTFDTSNLDSRKRNRKSKP